MARTNARANGRKKDRGRYDSNGYRDHAEVVGDIAAQHRQIRALAFSENAE
jgi:hypothetical protein